MMLMISVLRYRATVHPLKPAISRRKLKVVCGLVYIVGFIAGYGPALPLGFLPWNDVRTVYIKYLYTYNQGYNIIYFLFLLDLFIDTSTELLIISNLQFLKLKFETVRNSVCPYFFSFVGRKLSLSLKLISFCRSCLSPTKNTCVPYFENA